MDAGESLGETTGGLADDLELADDGILYDPIAVEGFTSGLADEFGNRSAAASM
jgi:hypothetical protein